MSRQLHRLFLATIGTVVLVVAGATSALAGMMPDPADPGVPRHPLPGSHYQMPKAPPGTSPDLFGPPALAVPWQYLAPVVVVAVALLLLAMRAHHLHTSQHTHVHLPFRRA